MVPSATITPTLFSLRCPSSTTAELVVTHNRKTMVFDLSFTQVRLLNSQTAKAIEHWPVKEIKDV